MATIRFMRTTLIVIINGGRDDDCQFSIFDKRNPSLEFGCATACIISSIAPVAEPEIAT